MDHLDSLPKGYLTANASGPLRNAAITLIVLETIFICLFLTSRILQKTASGPDMWLISISYCIYIAFAIVVFLIIKYGGVGQHILVLTQKAPNALIVWAKMQIAVLYLGTLSGTLPRLAILWLYLRFIRVRNYRWAIYLVGLLICLQCIAQITTISIECTSFSVNPDKTIKSNHSSPCGLVAVKVYMVPTILTDLVMFVLPLPTIWRLRTNISQKIGLTVTFFAGSIGMIAAIVKMYYYFTYDVKVDLTFRSAIWILLLFVESSMYIIAATLPSLRPLPGNIRKTNWYQGCRTYFACFGRGKNERATRGLNQGGGGGSEIIRTCIEERTSDEADSLPTVSKLPTIELSPTVAFDMEHIVTTKPPKSYVAAIKETQLRLK